MNQGDDYDEWDFDDDDETEATTATESDVSEGEYADEAKQNTKAGFDTIYGIPKNIFFIGCAIVVVALLALALIIMRFKNKSSSSSNTTSDYTYNDTYVDTTPTITQCYDSNGNFIGYCEGLTDGYSIYDNDYNDVGYIDASGTSMFYDSSGVFLGYYTSDTDDYVVDYTTTNASGSYSDSDKELLRKMGYTGDEIEIALATGVSVDDLVEAAQELRDEEAKEALHRMSDEASEEFQTIVNNSIYCMPEVTFDGFDVSVDSSRLYDGSYVVNADYEKLPTYGYQLFIKVKIANGTYVFYQVTPQRWETLPDTGNIVMKVSYCMYGTYNVNMYITDLQEVDATQLTVNPEDSGADLNDIIDGYSSTGNSTDTDSDEDTVETW
jgi:hypothetical protein